MSNESNARPTVPAPEAVKQMNLFQRINEVRKQVDYLKKEKTVSGQGYKAVTHDQVTAALRDHLIAYGIVVKPSLVAGATVQDTMMYTNKKIPIIRYEAEYDVHFINIDDPKDRDVMRVSAHALDQGDKAPGKAVSYATKAAELKMFNIETGENDEERTEDDAHGGMPLRVYDEFEKEIDALKTSKDGEPLWKRIIAECNKYEDAVAVTKLKGRLSAKVVALRKAAKPEDKKEARNAAHA